MPDPVSKPLFDSIAALVTDASLGRVLSIHPLKASGNNRAFQVTTTAGDILVKRYFVHPSDSRNRLDTEYRFSQYADTVAPGYIPRPIASRPDEQLAAYEFVDGMHIVAGEVTDRDVDTAIAFFTALNRPDARAQAQSLPTASEAVFSLAAHIQLVDRRMALLLAATTECSDGPRPFIRQLTEDWRTLVDQALGLAEQWGLAADENLPPAHHCLSPSDFGFHNVLRKGNGRLVFHDFEYAGWDDPTRMLGDFFAQPAVPAPQINYAQFLNRCSDLFPTAEKLAQRATLIRPIYLAKWCCIALGVFVPLTMQRRKFANPNLDETAVKKSQMAVATALFEKMRKEARELH